MTSWLAAAGWAALDGLVLCGEIVLVVAPFMIGYELAEARGWFARPWPGVGPAMRRLGLSQAGFVPLMAGVWLGLLYGAGLLLGLSREKNLPQGERLALAVFLVTCHAVVEDTAIFVLLGGSALWMLGPRLVLAVGLTAWLARRAARRDAKERNGQA